uniref:Glycosyl transferase n=1 Tax=Haemonchus placei TaxID=6290 RepID=A0A0N4WEC3_HAEPC
LILRFRTVRKKSRLTLTQFLMLNLITSYELIEEELRSSYHPQNVFCYAIDHKAKEDFTQKIEKLSKCLPNVLVPNTRYSIGRTGINGTRAHYECLKALMRIWSSLSAIHDSGFQNYDIMIKSVYETVSILQKLGGANDVHVRPCESYRYNQSLEWDVQSLKFFRNGALSVLGVDEVLIPTLQVSDSIDMPGRFTAECVQKGKVIGFITRSVYSAKVKIFKKWNQKCDQRMRHFTLNPTKGKRLTKKCSSTG